MLPKFIFWSLLALICGYALWRGHRDERIAATACLTASIATKFVISPIGSRYDGIETGLLIVDLAMLFTFIFIALRSDRFWPLWVAGLQLTMTMAHLLKAIELDLMPKAYAAAAIFWSYPILLILAVGTWRGHRRERAQAAPS
ncbi:MAG TPA: hypothetical protein VFK50_03945 [Sphingomicrobium sp.]|nr:hypothetical protein [Sphingomicrobium sp.]